MDTWKEMIEKVVEVEAKTGLQLAFYIWEMDHQTPRGNCSAYVIMAKVQTQGTTMKDPRIKKPKKAQEPKPANNSSGNVKISKKVWKESKKRF